MHTSLYRWPLRLVLAAACLAPPSLAAASAKQILDASGVTGGLVVHLGCGDGTLTAAFWEAANREPAKSAPGCLVHGLDPDPANVAKAREHVRQKGLAARVWVDRLAGDRLPYAEQMVNLLVSDDLGGVGMDEVLRVLVPHGVAYVKRGGRWAKTVKPWPDAIDEWTHWLHGPDGNAVARDTVAGPPRRFQWIAAPLWSRHHNTVPSVSAIVSAKGRLFTIVDEAPVSMDGSAPDNWALVARDAFNGFELWRRPIADWGWRSWATGFTCRFTVPTHMPRRLVAVGDRVYATLGFNAPLSELDAATGRALRTFDGTEFTDEILCLDGTLLLAVNKKAQKPGGAKAPSPPPVRKWVAALDAASGKMLWKTGDYVGLRSKTGPMERVSHLSMAAAGGQVFFVDRDRIVSLRIADGRETWRVPRPQVPEHPMRYNIRITDMCSLVAGDGVVLFAQLSPDRKIDWREIQGRLHAFAADTGRELWSRPCASWGWGHPADVFLIDGLVWAHGYESTKRSARQGRPGAAGDLGPQDARARSDSAFIFGLDPATGAVRRKVSTLAAFDNGHHHRCYRNKATSRFLMTSYRGLEFIDWASGQVGFQHWVRGTCRLGAIPCNGMVYATPHPCDCYITSKLNGFLALAPARRFQVPGSGFQDARLERGPAYNANLKPGTRNPEPRDWPTYRHDPERSGSTPCAVPTPLKTLWRVEAGGRPTSCVVADGRLFVASQATRELLALSATDGTLLWRFTAGGRADTPPTICKGRVVLGCADGWVYCLRASDGRLAWRFRAAPRERRVGAFGGIESAWPVHGSVLVRGNTVYCTAGRSSFLDGGIVACALRLDAGEIISQHRARSDHAMPVGTGRRQSVDTGLLSDLLVAVGDGIHMRQRRLFGAAPEQGKGRPLRSTAGLLDASWHSRTRWFLGDVPYAEYMVSDAASVYGVRARPSMSANGSLFKPGAKGYQLFAADLTPAPARKPTAKAARTPRRRVRDRWHISVPVRVTAMALAADTLFAAGHPDVIDPQDAWAAYEGRRGGKLLVLAAADGTQRAEHDLPAPPVLDGLAVARGRLYVALMDGSVACLGAE